MPNPQSEIEQLLESHPPDDPKIIEAAVKHYYPEVYRLSISILKDRDAAEDVTQDTFITAALKLDQFQGRAQFKTWLFTIAVNACRDHLRRKKTRQKFYNTLRAIQFLVPRPLLPEESALQNETQAQLWAAVDELGERQRVPIILHIAHDLSVHEISQILNVKEKTIYSRLYAGFRKLRQSLDGSVDLDFDEEKRKEVFG